MMKPPNVAGRPGLQARSWSRALAVVLICASVALLLSFDAVNDSLQRALSAAQPSIAGHPRLGAVAFVLFAALSAILAFFSSALLLPVAVYTWGTTVTLVLLWLGWLLGGICTYALGRMLRRPREGMHRAFSKIDFYLHRTPGDVTFALVLLLCLALPSEIPGYLCGYLGVRIRTYVPALAMAELPYAIGAVMLGQGVAHRQIGWLLAVGFIGALLSLLALRALHKRLEPPS
jgi:uncharacterized membrane protein YdjX (TVP38/TMEM64 family)